MPDAETLVAYIDKAVEALGARFDDAFDTHGLTPPTPDQDGEISPEDFAAFQQQLLAELQEAGLGPPDARGQLDAAFVRDQGAGLLDQLMALMTDADDAPDLPRVVRDEDGGATLDLSALLGPPPEDDEGGSLP
ncbi:MAG: hypothetical protein CSA66_03450 [Proteobacteria bacterium]|nr:MAG: hypothetical protein CSA66_03450 [Pseudomonadota bacterium]